MERKLYSLRGGLKKARKRAGIKQSDLAEKMGVSLKTIMNWEQGLVNPDLETTILLANLLNCDLDYLTGRIEERTHDIKTACEITGLSIKAVDKIVSNSESKRPLREPLSYLIESELFMDFIGAYNTFLEFLSVLSGEDLTYPLAWHTLDNGKIALGTNRAIMYFKQEVSDAITRLCDDNYFKQSSKALSDLFDNEDPSTFSVSVEPGKVTVHREDTSVDKSDVKE